MKLASIGPTIIEIEHCGSYTPRGCEALASLKASLYLDIWSGFEAAKTVPWPSGGLHHLGKFFEH